MDPPLRREAKLKLKELLSLKVYPFTLIIALKVEDHKAGIVRQALKKLQYMLDRPPGKLKLDFFSQSNFIGLFVQEAYYKYLTEVTSHFVTEVKKSGIYVCQCSRQEGVTGII